MLVIKLQDPKKFNKEENPLEWVVLVRPTKNTKSIFNFDLPKNLKNP
jgi:hypothetical protein